MMWIHEGVSYMLHERLMARRETSPGFNPTRKGENIVGDECRQTHEINFLLVEIESICAVFLCLTT